MKCYTLTETEAAIVDSKNDREIHALMKAIMAQHDGEICHPDGYVIECQR